MWATNACWELQSEINKETYWVSAMCGLLQVSEHMVLDSHFYHCIYFLTENPYFWKDCFNQGLNNYLNGLPYLSRFQSPHKNKMKVSQNRWLLLTITKKNRGLRTVQHLYSKNVQEWKNIQCKVKLNMITSQRDEREK